MARSRPSRKAPSRSGTAGKRPASPARKPSVLVTGATGFVGRHLVPALLTCGYSVTCLVRNDPGPGLWADCRMILGDLTDEASIAQAVEGVEVVIHAGAAVITNDTESLTKVNVQGTQTLVNHSRRGGVKHFIFISSVDVGHGTQYGQSKSHGETIVKESGIPYTILRPGPIYGPDDDKNLTELFALVRTKKVIPVIGDGNYLRQPIHVDEVVEAIVRVINSVRAIGKTYYLGGPSITYNEILAAMVDASDNRPTIVHLPSGLAKTLVLTLQKFGLGPSSTADQIRTIDHDKVGDITAFENDFDFKAKPFPQGFSLAMDERHSGNKSKKKVRANSRSDKK